MLIAAACLTFLIGIIHSVLGERFILRCLFRRNNLPIIMGDVFYTKQTLRMAWHITTIAWWGLALILLRLAGVESSTKSDILIIISAVFAVSGLAALIFSKGRHLSWIIFFSIAGLTSYVSNFG